MKISPHKFAALILILLATIVTIVVSVWIYEGLSKLLYE